MRYELTDYEWTAIKPFLPSWISMARRYRLASLRARRMTISFALFS
jgi:transposase